MRALLILVTAGALAAPPEPVFRAVTLDAKIQIGYGVAVADVDGDKAPDVLLADKKQFVWYRNPGPEKCADPAAWTKHLLAENLTEKDNVCLAAEDLDGDGKCEIAVGAEWNPGDTEKSGAVFSLLAPADRTQPWEAVKFPAVEPTTHRMKWLKLADNQWGLIVVPLHGRGNKNGQGAPVKILLYHRPDDPRGAWKSEIVDEAMHATHNFDVLKQRGFPLPQVLIAGREGIRMVQRQTGRWAEVPLPAEFPPAGIGEVREGLIRTESGRQGNFFAAIEPMHGTTLAVYLSAPLLGKVNPASWTRRVLTDRLTEGHALACGDVLGTGSDQVVVGWRGHPAQPRPVGIKLFTPLDARGEQWRESFIDDNEMACEDLVLADLNADRKLDVIASGRATRNVKIYLNDTDAR
jgi:hypothetical protein